MKYRESLNVPNNYPFGIEIEIANKNIFEIDQMFTNQSNFVSIIPNLGQVSCEYGLNYALSINNKFIFTIPEKLKDYWLYYYENVNGNGSDYGVEISSPILYNESMDWKTIKLVLQHLQNNGVQVNENCGAHIHFGSFPFQKEYSKLFSYFLFYLLFEPVFYKFSAFGEFGHLRKNIEKYANPISSQIACENLDLNTLICYIKNNQTKDEKINALHFKDFQLEKESYGSSFEIRMFNGTLDEIVWQNYINFSLSFLAFSINNSFDQKKILRRVQQELKIRREWSLEDYLVNADCLVDEVVSLIFPYQIDRDNFYEQYSGDYLKKRKAIA